MGIFLEPRLVTGPEGLPLTGATHGSAAHFAIALKQIQTDPVAAKIRLDLALLLAPRFVLAFVARAYLCVRTNPAMAAAWVEIARSMSPNRREAALIKIFCADKHGKSLECAMETHLAFWPGDSFAQAVLSDLRAY